MQNKCALKVYNFPTTFLVLVAGLVWNEPTSLFYYFVFCAILPTKFIGKHRCLVTNNNCVGGGICKTIITEVEWWSSGWETVRKKRIHIGIIISHSWKNSYLIRIMEKNKIKHTHTWVWVISTAKHTDIVTVTPPTLAILISRECRNNSIYCKIIRS